jgi:hypothetical protein
VTEKYKQFYYQCNKLTQADLEESKANIQKQMALQKNDDIEP